MDQATTYALLAADAYWDIRSLDQNWSPMPAGWRDLNVFDISHSGSSSTFVGNGFSARVFQGPAGEIVISYAGTEFGGSTSGGISDFVSGNIPLAIGKYGEQAYEAALLYQRVQEFFGATANVSFTGHSLGGGLAGLMSVWFDRPALVFDPAPFERSADDSAGFDAMRNVRSKLADQGFHDPKFDRYSYSADFVNRESRVVSYAVSGEVLELIPSTFARIEASRKSYLIGAAPDLAGSERHSVDLLAAVMLSPDFDAAAKAVAPLLPMMFDGSLYGATALGGERNLLVRLLRGEAGVYNSATGAAQIAPNGALGKFSNDIQRLNTADGMVGQPVVQRALIAAAMEYYYYKDLASATQLFTASGNGIHFNYSDSGSTDSRALSRLANAINGYLSNDELRALGAIADPAQIRDDVGTGRLMAQRSWHVQSGTSGMFWTGAGIERDAAIGGAQTDNLDGGAGDDILVGGAGQDFLTGGTGRDTLIGGVGLDWLDGGAGDDILMGGEGTDIYHFTRAWGSDSIQDSDGQGVLQVEGFASGLPQGKKIGEGRYRSADASVTYTLAQLGGTSTDLILGFAGKSDQIIIRNWINGQFGITFDDVPVPATTTKVGDAQADPNDALVGTAGGDQLLGLSGNDALSGLDGDDVLEGGLGSDLLAGGLGADVLNGGDGSDYIFGSADAGLAGWSDSRGQWSVVTGTGWGIPGVSAPIAGDAGNVIDGGDGNDWIAAGTGGDYVQGGAGADLVYAMAGNDVVEGGDGDDELHGDSPNIQLGNYNTTAVDEYGDDFVDGGAGNDTLYGEGGDDELYGGTGDDLIDGDVTKADIPTSVNGNDYLDGEDGNDTLIGNGGADTLYGGTGNDYLVGDIAYANIADQLQGANHGDDELDGGEGDDILIGAGGADVLEGGAGNDSLFGDSGGVGVYLDATYQGNDYLDGGDGNDFVEGEGGSDTLYGGNGNDTLIGDDSESRLLGAAQQGDYLDGEAGDDVLSGYGGADTLFGGDGKDLLIGDQSPTEIAGIYHGADYLDGEAGNDTLIGGGGNDTLFGSAGDDVLVGDTEANTSVEQLAAVYHGGDQLDGGEGNDSLTGTGGADALWGGTGNDTLFGDDAVARLGVAAHGNDTLEGGDGADLLQGDGGDDALFGGAGNDSMWGDIGLRAGESSGASVVGNDYLDGEDGNDVLLGGGGNDTLIGGAGNDWLSGEYDVGGATASALTGNDALDGGDGNDTLLGGNGNDSLLGGSGDDTLFGGAGSDTLNGGSGSDALDGGDGDDVLLVGNHDSARGGAGNNVYRIAQDASSGLITLVQGALGQDRIVFDAAVSGVALYKVSAGVATAENTGADLYVSFGVGRGVWVDNFFQSATEAASAPNNLLSIQMADGTVITDASLRAAAVAQGVTTYSINKPDQPWRGTIRWAETNQSYVLPGGTDDATLTGTANAWLQGNGVANYLLGNAGNNTLLGAAGNDTLDGGAGDDILDGGDGNDTLREFAGNSTMYGGAGDDFLANYGTGSSLFDGGDGNDYLQVTSGTNRLDGGNGDDTIAGADGDDTITGGRGDDYITDFGGSNTYVFNRGDGHDFMEYGLGQGTLRFGVGISQTDVLVNPDRTLSDRVTLQLAGDGDSFSMSGVYTADDPTGQQVSIQRVEFADGSVWDVQALIARSWHATSGNDNWRGTSAADSMSGGTGNDNLIGFAGNDSLDGGVGDDQLEGGSGNDLVIGGAGNDALYGDASPWNLGEAGNDTLDGGAGDDTMYGGLGGDVYLFGKGDGHDVISASSTASATDTLQFKAGVLASEVSVAIDGGHAIFTIAGSGETVDFGELFPYYSAAKKQVRFADGTSWNESAILARATRGTAGDDYIVGFQVAESISSLEGNDYVSAEGGNDTVDGGSGNDSLYGGSGSDLLLGGAGDDYLNGEGGNDTLDGGLGNDELAGQAGSLFLFGKGDGQDSIFQYYGTGTDSLRFKAGVVAGEVKLVRTGDDLVIGFATSADTVTVAGYFIPNTAERPIVQLSQFKFADGTVWSRATIDARVGLVNHAPVLAVALPDQSAAQGAPLSVTVPTTTFIDTDSGDTLIYGATLGDGSGLPGWLSFNTGTRTFSGTPMVLGTVSVKVYATDTGGLVASDIFDIAVSLKNLSLTGTASAETLTGGTGNDSLSGLAGNDSLVGNAGNDVLDGGAGTDTMLGGAGDDSYFVDATTDVVTESAGEGTDTAQSAVTFTLGANLENLILTGTTAINGTGNALDNILTGNSANNTLTGAAGNDTLDGGLGNDTMLGGAGNDTYVVNVATDVVTENASEGIDTVQSAVTWTLGANVENLTLTGTMAINGTGNTLNNVLTGNAAGNTLDGGAGADTLLGGAGNDIYVVDNIGDAVTETAGEGIDAVQSAVTFTLSAEVENLTLIGTAAISGTGNALDNLLTGNSAANQLSGGAGNDSLDGGTGADTMAGGLGNDSYTVDNTADAITENLNEGLDVVQSSVTYTLGANLENLTLTGTTAINGTGNALDNVLTGNSANNTLTGGAGNDTLDGGLGNDTMLGGAGNDNYVVNVATDVVTENAAEGTDTVLSAVTWTLGANVENLTLTGTTAVNGTGNTLANVLIGNVATNTLDGGTGADTLVGGAGDDFYVVDNSADVVTEVAGEGADLVNSSVSYTLGAEVEKLTLTGTVAINGTGNALDNLLTGNGGVNTLTGGSGNDSLDGGAGADVLVGGLGNDTYTVDNTGDVVTENVGEGIDLVQSSVTHTLAANVENLLLTGTTAINGTGNALDNALTGNSANNTLTGGAGNDTLDGGLGNDTMLGGAGNDTYVVNVATDVVTENAAEGVDTVQSAVTWTLGANVEILLLTGATAINGTGNTLDNALTGNSANNTLTGGAGNDTLDGGLGNDTMLGGAGDDTYVVNVATDVVTENASEGTDTVQSAVTWTLGTNLENLTLAGAAAINGTGNASANTLLGNAAVNTLAGGEGADIYDGGAGNDALTDTSTSSSDTYRWGLGSGIDTVTDAGGTLDHVDVFAGITKAQLKFVKNASDLEMSVTGQAADKLIVKNWYASAVNQVEEFRLSDGSKVLASEVAGLLSAMAVFDVSSAMMTSGPLAPSVRTMDISRYQDLLASSN